MKKQKILRCLVFCPLLFSIILLFCDFFISSLAVAEGLSVIQTLNQKKNSSQESRAIDIKRRYLKSMRACKGLKRTRGKGNVVALTFDDGPNDKYTKEILNILRSNNIKATFFFIGKNVEDYPDVVRTAYKEGHVIGNHSYSHNYLTRLSKNRIVRELEQTSNLVNGIIGRYPLLFRPPYGCCSDQSTIVAGTLGFRTIMWSAMVDDYNSETTVDKIATGIINLVKPGVIIGLHDGGGNREKTVGALPIIIRALKRQGYEFLTIPELLNVPAYSYSSHAEKKRLVPVKVPAKRLVEKSTLHILKARDLTFY